MDTAGTTALPSIQIGSALRERGATRLAVGAALLYLASAFTTSPEGPPVGTATAADIRAFAAANADALRLTALGGAVGLVAVVMLASALATMIRIRMPDSPLASLTLGGGVLIAVLHWLGTAATALPAVLPGLIDTELAAVDDATVRSWYALTGYTHFLGDLWIAPIALVLATVSVAALHSGVLPRWLGWLGLVLAGSGALGLVGVTLSIPILYPFWFGGLFGWAVWTLLTGITLGLRLRHRSRTS